MPEVAKILIFGHLDLAAAGVSFQIGPAARWSSNMCMPLRGLLGCRALRVFWLSTGIEPTTPLGLRLRYILAEMYF